MLFASRRYIGLIAVALIAVGSAVCVAWWLKVAPVLQILPNSAPMQFNAALLFILSGTSLGTCALGRHRLAMVAAALTGLLATLTLFEFLTSTALGIDELFAKAYLTTQTSHPGRMAPNAAVAFVLASGALSMLALARYRTATVVLGSLVSAMGLVSLLGYVFDISTAYGWGNLTRMAVHTSAAFTILGAGVVLAVAAGERTNRWSEVPWIGVLAGTFVAALSILSWQALEQDSHKRTRALLELRANEVTVSLVNTAREHLATIERLASRFGQNVYRTGDLWVTDGAAYLASRPAIDLIQIQDAAGNVLAEVSRPDRHPDAALTRQISARFTAAETPAATGTQSDTRSEHGYIWYQTAPSAYQDSFIRVLFRVAVEPMARREILRQADQDYRLEITPDGVKRSALSLSALAVIALPEPMTGLYVVLDASENPAMGYSSLPSVLLVGGLALALLLALAINQFQAARIRSRQLLVATELSRSVIETAHDAFISITSDGKVRDWNRQAEVMFGRAREDVMGNSITELIIPPEHREANNQGLRRYVDSRQGPVLNRRIEITGLHRDGREFPVEVTIWPIHSGGSTIINAFLHDISERKAAEAKLVRYADELKRSNRDLERSNRDLEQFGYVASHDLQAPLRSIMGFSRLLQKELGSTLSTSATEYLGFITESAGQMQTLIRGLLAYSRIGRGESVVEPTDCNAIVEQVLSQMKFSIQDRGAVITHDPLPTLPATALDLTMLFQNLISNAIKFQPGQGPQVHIGTERQGDFWTISVRDQGIGIENEHLEQIFHVFKRLHSIDKYEGTGIGLSICQKIVERHGGRIWVESEPGKGSTFYFTLAA